MAKVGIYRDFDRMRSGTQTQNGRCPLNVNVNVNSRFIQHIIAKPLMRRVREKKFSGRGENCQGNVTDLADSLVTSCRPPGRLQNTPDDRTSNAGVAVLKSRTVCHNMFK